MEVSVQRPLAHQPSHLQAENTILQITDTVAELQEGQRYPERDERVDEQPTEHVVGGPPELFVVPVDDIAELIPEGRCVYMPIVHVNMLSVRTTRLTTYTAWTSFPRLDHESGA